MLCYKQHANHNTFIYPRLTNPFPVMITLTNEDLQHSIKLYNA